MATIEILGEAHQIIKDNLIFENPFEGFQKNLNKLIPGGGKGKRGFFLIFIVIVLLWALSGLYRVNADEQGLF